MKVVDVADMKISDSPDEELITYALGSCIGICVHDPVANIGGLLHVMLPLSTIDPDKARHNPFVFMDTGVPRLFLECYKAGARKERLVVKAAGGASPLGDPENDVFCVGKRNFTMLRKLLWHNGLLLKSYDVGGTLSRTMILRVGTGEVIVKTNGTSTLL